MDILSIFAERLKALMKDNCLSVSDFAKAILIDSSEVRRYLLSNNLPSTVTAVKIADYFECSLDFLFGLSDDTDVISGNTEIKFNERFKTILQEKECSRYKLQKGTNLPVRSIQNWYNNVYVPKIDSLIRLSRYFNCTLDYLVGRN